MMIRSGEITKQKSLKRSGSLISEKYHTENCNSQEGNFWVEWEVLSVWIGVLDYQDQNEVCEEVLTWWNQNFLTVIVERTDGAVDSIKASSSKVWIQLDKMFLTLFLLPSWMRCKLYGRKCVLMYFLFIWWLLLRWFFVIMDN